MTVGRLGAVRFGDRIQHSLLWLLIGSYALAAIWPEPGLRLRSLDVGSLVSVHRAHAPLPSLLLAFLLFNAGLGVESRRFLQLARRPGTLAMGVFANLTLPVAFILVMAASLRFWHNPRAMHGRCCAMWERSALR